VKFTSLLTAVAFLTASLSVFGQSSSSSSSSLDSEAILGGGHTALATTPAYSAPSTRPFSKVAFGVGVSPLGVQLAMTTNVYQHLNVRTTGNLFDYSTNFTTSGITSDAKLDMKSAGSTLDLYPFRTGFRISPGVLFYNRNQVIAAAEVPGGTTFTLNNQTYYSANANPTTGATPVNGNAVLNLHTTNPAFTITTGWGDTIPRKGHWSFPFEVGIALTGAPSLNVNLGGWACYDQAQTLCTDINSKTDPIALQIQSNLQTQVAKWTNDLQLLKTYPIASFGVAYSFGLRSQ